MRVNVWSVWSSQSYVVSPLAFEVIALVVKQVADPACTILDTMTQLDIPLRFDRIII
jgi:hypothetical protein